MAHHRSASHKSGRHDARHGVHATCQLAQKGRALGGCFVTGIRERDRHAQGMIDPDARLHLIQVRKAMQEKSRCYQKHEGKRHLGHYENVAKPSLRAAGILQSIREIGT
jgi:hypothetical protein